MDFTLPAMVFLKQTFNLKGLSGQEKFLAISASLAKGETWVSLTAKQIQKEWLKTVLHIGYSDTYYRRAQSEGWVNPNSLGRFNLTDSGLRHLTRLEDENVLAPPPGTASGLCIFTVGMTHTFDKHLRQLLSQSSHVVKIVDSYVDETVFDNLLDQIPKNISVQLIYGHSMGSFDARAKRFKVEYTNFIAKNDATAHDRFLIIDGIGYILGPSLKDAARKSSALLTALDRDDSKKLEAFFDNLWSSIT